MTEKTTKKHVFAFLLDHATPSFFFDYVDKGMAPHVSKYILGEKNKDNTYSNATISRHIVTGFPTSSANSHTSILTGSFAGKNDLIFEKYWNLTGKKPIYVMTSEITAQALSAFNKKYINQHCKTLFEHVDDSASFHLISRGASFKLFTFGNILMSFLPIFLKMRKLEEPGAMSPIDTPEVWRQLFEKHIPKYLKRVKKEGKLPQASFIIFLLSDANAHQFGFDSKEYKEAVSVLDYCVQLIVEGFDEKNGKHVEGLKELGFLDSIVWNINTDHAGRLVQRDKYIMLGANLEAELGLRLIDGLEKKAGEKPIKRLKGSYAHVNGFSSINSAHADFWFSPDGDGLPSFTRFHGEQLFRKITPRNEVFKGSREPVDLIEHLLSKEYNHLIFIPEEDVTNPIEEIDPSTRIKEMIPREYVIKVLSSKGSGKITRAVKDGNIQYSYAIIDGEDPLEYSKVGLEYGKFHSNREWLEKTIDNDLPDVFHRIFGMFDAIYAPNLVVTSLFNNQYWSRLETFHKSLKNKQSHGGLYSIESVVPATFAGPGIKKGGEIPSGRNIDILPTLLKVLDCEYDEVKLDGKPLEEAFSK